METRLMQLNIQVPIEFMLHMKQYTNIHISSFHQEIDIISKMVKC